jgi:hypothetical protein
VLGIERWTRSFGVRAWAAGTSVQPVEKGSQQAENEVVARIIGWLAALADVPFIIHKYRRGWSRPSDVGEFYALIGVLFWGVSAAHRGALGLPTSSCSL